MLCCPHFNAPYKVFETGRLISLLKYDSNYKFIRINVWVYSQIVRFFFLSVAQILRLPVSPSLEKQNKI